MKSQNTNRQTRYQASDLRYDYDDVIFSITYAYINALAHVKYDPENIAGEATTKQVTVRYVQTKETNYRMRLARVDKNGKVLKIIK